MVLLNMSLLWYALLFNGNWQIGTSEGIYDMIWKQDVLYVEKDNKCQWIIDEGLQKDCPKITNVETVDNKVKVTGTAKPNTKLKITIK